VATVFVWADVLSYYIRSYIFTTASCFMLRSEGRRMPAWDMAGEMERKVILVLNEAPIHEDV
jgi:hypothetical protein